MGGFPSGPEPKPAKAVNKAVKKPLSEKRIGARELDGTVYNLYGIFVTAREIMNILKANGWKLERVNGSHHVFSKSGCRPVSVPFHGNKDIGNLGKRILKEAGIN